MLVAEPVLQTAAGRRLMHGGQPRDVRPAPHDRPLPSDLRVLHRRRRRLGWSAPAAWSSPATGWGPADQRLGPGRDAGRASASPSMSRPACRGPGPASASRSTPRLAVPVPRGLRPSWITLLAGIGGVAGLHRRDAVHGPGPVRDADDRPEWMIASWARRAVAIDPLGVAEVRGRSGGPGPTGQRPQARRPAAGGRHRRVHPGGRAGGRRGEGPPSGAAGRLAMTGRARALGGRVPAGIRPGVRPRRAARHAGFVARHPRLHPVFLRHPSLSDCQRARTLPFAVRGFHGDATPACRRTNRDPWQERAVRRGLQSVVFPASPPRAQG